MAICFVFVKYLTHTGCMSVRLNAKGDVESPLMHRLFQDIKLLQINATTIIIASTELFSLYQVKLPRLPDKKARQAIPFSLEHKLAQNLEMLHFSFDRVHYANGHYQVVVGELAYLNQLLSIMRTHQLAVDVITVDWFALAAEEVVVLDTNILVYDNPVFNGSLPIAAAPIYLKQQSNVTIYTFANSQTKLTIADADYQQDDFLLWVARRLQTSKKINLNQGAIIYQSNDSSNLWFKAAVAMTIFWLMSFCIVNTVKFYQINHEIADLDQHIAVLYHQFFPTSTQVISPGFRVKQLIKTTKVNNDEVFWILLNQFAQAIAKSNVDIDQINVQHGVMRVNLSCQDFNALETIELALQQRHIIVKQLQASSLKGRVNAQLELKTS